MDDNENIVDYGEDDKNSKGGKVLHDPLKFFIRIVQLYYAIN